MAYDTISKIVPNFHFTLYPLTIFSFLFLAQKEKGNARKKKESPKS